MLKHDLLLTGKDCDSSIRSHRRERGLEEGMTLHVCRYLLYSKSLVRLHPREGVFPLSCFRATLLCGQAEGVDRSCYARQGVHRVTYSHERTPERNFEIQDCYLRSDRRERGDCGHEVCRSRRYRKFRHAV